MAEIDDKGQVNEDRKLDLRDVVSAWLICALVAAVALAFSGNPRGPPASAPVVSGLILSGGSAGYDGNCASPARPELLCAASPNTARRATSHHCCNRL